MDLDRKWAVAVGITVRELRKNGDMTQERFAQVSSLTRNHVQRIEHGTTFVTLDGLVRIANALDVQLPELLTRAQELVLAPELMRLAVRKLKQEAVRGRPPRKPSAQ